VRISGSDGVRAPFSILETLVKCQFASMARARAVRFASLRISRRRAPSACRACWTDAVNLDCVLVVRDGEFPYGFERCPAQVHYFRVVGDLLA